MSGAPLSRRLTANGKATFAMNPVREQARSEILAKLDRGIYRLISIHCPGCQSDLKELISEKDATGLPVHTSLCLECGLVYASLRFDDRSLAEFYNNENLRLDRGLFSAEEFLFNLEVEKAQLIMNFLDRHGLLEECLGSVVIEIGCGAGGILSAFKQRGFEIAGFDLDPAVVTYGSKQKGLDLYQGGVDEAREVLALKGKYPSLIIYEQALEHFSDPGAELKKVRTIMGPGTILFVGVPGLRNIGNHYKYDLLNYLQPGHLVHFERLTLCRMFEEQGFAPIEVTEQINAVVKKASTNGSAPQRPYSEDAARDMLQYLVSIERKWRVLSVKRFAVRVRRAIVRRVKRPFAAAMSMGHRDWHTL